jgi:hypothetical protein
MGTEIDVTVAAGENEECNAAVVGILKCLPTRDVAILRCSGADWFVMLSFCCRLFPAKTLMEVPILQEDTEQVDEHTVADAEWE